LHLSSGVIDLPPGSGRRIIKEDGAVVAFAPPGIPSSDDDGTGRYCSTRGPVDREAVQPARIREEVAELGKSDLICFESHGVSHAAMSTLTDEELVFR
jgi:hypothetical protein